MTTIKNIPFLNLSIDEKEREELLYAIEKVFKHGRFIIGPEVIEFENILKNYFQRKYAIGVSSGSDALFLSLRALNIQKEDEIITTSLSWIATANAIAKAGATPIFADIRDDLNIDPESIKKLITKKTKVILPVHFTGKTCEMDIIKKIAKDNNLLLIEDAAQAFGASYKKQKVGTFGKIACFSMNPMKIFGACGEAGIILTDDEAIYKKLLILRYNGTVNKEECVEVSLNYRLDTIQAAILINRFKNVQNIINKRRKIARLYNELLKNIIKTPKEDVESFDVFYTYTIQCKKRDLLIRYLSDKGIETKIQHPYLMPHQSVYKNCKHLDHKAKNLVKTILSLPCNEKMVEEDAIYISKCIKEFYAK